MKAGNILQNSTNLFGNQNKWKHTLSNDKEWKPILPNESEWKSVSSAVNQVNEWKPTPSVGQKDVSRSAINTWDLRTIYSSPIDFLELLQTKNPLETVLPQPDRTERDVDMAGKLENLYIQTVLRRHYGDKTSSSQSSRSRARQQISRPCKDVTQAGSSTCRCCGLDELSLTLASYGSPRAGQQKMYNRPSLFTNSITNAKISSAKNKVILSPLPARMSSGFRVDSSKPKRSKYERLPHIFRSLNQDQQETDSALSTIVAPTLAHLLTRKSIN